jgi:hypothetical protein
MKRLRYLALMSFIVLFMNVDTIPFSTNTCIKACWVTFCYRIMVWKELQWKLSDWTFVINEPLLTLNISWRMMILAILIHLFRMNPITLNIEHKFWNAPLKIVLVTLNTCVSHSVSITVISQFIMILSYSSCNAFKCCSKRREIQTMSGKRKYTKKTLAEKAKTLQDLDSGMSVRACAAKYSISVATIIN